MAEFDSFFSNMSDREKRAWYSMSPEERIKMARKRQIEKRRAKAEATAAKIAEAKEFHRKSREYKGDDKFRLFPELRGDSDAPPELQLTDYRGIKGTRGSLSNIPPVTDTDTGEGEYSLATSPEGQAAKELADEKLGLSERAISVSPGWASAIKSSKESAESEIPWWKKLGLSKGLDHATEQIKEDSRIIDKDEILERQAVERQIELQKEEEAARKQAEADAAQAKLDKHDYPRTVRPTNTLMKRLQEYNKSDKSGNIRLARAADAEQFEEDYQDAAFDSPEEEHKREIKDQLDLMQNREQMIIDAKKKRDKDGKGLINLNQEENKDATDVLKKEVKKVEVKKKGTKKGKDVTGDFVRFDNGYPVYRKGSKWAKSFNDAFGKSLEDPNNKTFSWTGHDGVSRSYTNNRATKIVEESNANIDTKPPSVITGKPSPHLDEKEADPSTLMPQISEYQTAKTSKAREDALFRATSNATTDQEKKDIRAAIKEQAEGPDKYWIDPRTGYALNLSRIARRVKRKDEMEMAALFPPADRAAYLFSKKMIDSEDFDAIMKNPNQRRELEFKLKNLQIKEAQLKIAAHQRKAKINPQRAEWLKLYENAVTNDDYEMQILLGKKLGFSEAELKLSTDGRRKFEDNKLAGKGMKDEFKSTFHTPYSNVINKHDNWIKRASSIIQTEGMIDAIGLDGKKYVDRRGYFRSFGLFEQADMLKQPNKGKLISEMPYFERIRNNEEFAGSDGEFDPNKFIKNTVAYEKHLLDSLVYLGMDKSYSGQWPRMLEFITGVQQPSSIDGILSNQPQEGSKEGEASTSWGL